MVIRFKCFPPARRVKLYLALLFSLALAQGFWVFAFESSARQGGDWKAREAYLREEILGHRAGEGQMPKILDAHYRGEWAMGTYSMYAAALTNLAFLNPETRSEALTILSRLVEHAETREFRQFDVNRWGEDPLETLSDGRGHIGYLGHLNWMYGAYRLAGGDERFDGNFTRVTQALARRVKSSRNRLVETYPGEIYVPDNVVVYASIRNYDLVFGTRHGAVVDEWIALARREQIDSATGLLQFRYKGDGRLFQGPRGCGAGWNSFYLPFVSRSLAEDQYAAMRKQLIKRLPFGAAGLREYPPGITGSGDVDSGPVILELSTSGTGFAMAGARHAKDTEILNGLTITAELVGHSVQWAGKRRYLFAPLVGEAIVLAMRTAVLWDGRYLTGAKSTR